MKKTFEMPSMAVTSFDIENVVTASGSIEQAQTYEAAAATLELGEQAEANKFSFVF